MHPFVRLMIILFYYIIKWIREIYNKNNPFHYLIISLFWLRLSEVEHCKKPSAALF